MKVSTTSPVRDVRANLQGSFSTFSSRQRQLTFKKKKKESIIHNGQKAEANPVSINGWIIKRVCIHSGLLYSLEKGRTFCHRLYHR